MCPIHHSSYITNTVGGAYETMQRERFQIDTSAADVEDSSSSISTLPVQQYRITSSEVEYERKIVGTKPDGTALLTF